LTLVSAGRVGKPHGLEGSFYVEAPHHELPVGTDLLVASERRTVERRAGTDRRPLIRLSGVADPRPLRGKTLLVEDELADDEWLASELVGCEVPGLGLVARVIDAPSCSLLELEGGTLIPLISPAIESVDVEARVIRVKPGFLG
jgi:16S rRNA processing protein RimM